jgi:hypothetical protein
MPDRRIPVALLALRIGIFILMAAWTVDKFVRPEHAGLQAEQFYLLKAFGKAVVYLVAVLESALLVAFLLGLAAPSGSGRSENAAMRSGCCRRGPMVTLRRQVGRVGRTSGASARAY